MAAPQDLEIELKLEADPASLADLAGAPILAGVALREQRQVSTYFDGPGQALRAAGLSLRIRRIGERYVQTVKAEGASAAGLFARPEWEREINGAAPLIDESAGPLATLVPGEVLRRLTPAFSVDVTRRIATIHHDGAEIELVTDSGSITAGDRTLPIAEVELELKSGPRAALFGLARALDAIVPLRLGVLAKSDRGYRLLAGREEKAIKSEPLVLPADASAGDAFQRIAGACLRQFRLNQDLLAVSAGPAPLHQARVAVRRLRSALSIFKPMLADDRYEHLRGELRWLAASLGDVRDLDVLLQRKVAGAEAPLRAARATAYAETAAVLAGDRTRALMIDLSEWIAIGAWRMAPAEPSVVEGPAAAFAAETLDRLRRRVKRRGRKLAKLSDEDRHEVRILAKKLRYAAEFFAGLFTGKKAARRVGPFLVALERLQDQLGTLNDIAHGPEVLARLGIAHPAEADAVERRAALLVAAEEAHAGLIDARPFWR